MAFSISGVMMILYQAVNFSKVTACRQEAWLKSTELVTHQKMDHPSNQSLYHSKCEILVSGTKKIIWRQIPNGKSKQFKIMLSGNL